MRFWHLYVCWRIIWSVLGLSYFCFVCTQNIDPQLDCALWFACTRITLVGSLGSCRGSTSANLRPSSKTLRDLGSFAANYAVGCDQQIQTVPCTAKSAFGQSASDWLSEIWKAATRRTETHREVSFLHVRQLRSFAILTCLSIAW